MLNESEKGAAVCTQIAQPAHAPERQGKEITFEFPHSISKADRGPNETAPLISSADKKTATFCARDTCIRSDAVTNPVAFCEWSAYFNISATSRTGSCCKSDTMALCNSLSPKAEPRRIPPQHVDSRTPNATLAQVKTMQASPTGTVTLTPSPTRVLQLSAADSRAPFPERPHDLYISAPRLPRPLQSPSPSPRVSPSPNCIVLFSA